MKRALTLAVGLVILDAFLFNQGFLSLLIGIGLIVIGLPRVFLRKFAGQRAAKLRNLAIYAAAIGVVLLLNAANNRIAESRANALITAVKAFHAKYQRYPDALSALVPEFITEVPRAKYTLQYGQFSYFVTGGKAILYYVALPPFGRPTYDFAKDAWGYLD